MASLSDRTLEGVPLSDGSGPDGAAAFAALVEPLADVDVSVSLADVTEGPDQGGDEGGDGATESASALLDWAWELPGGTWEYSSSADLVTEGEEWVLAWDPRLLHPDLLEGDALSLSGGSGPRGRVLGAGGTPIVLDRPVLRYGIDKSKVDSAQAVASAREVAAILGVDRRSFVDRVKGYGPKAFVEAVALRTEDVRRRAGGVRRRTGGRGDRGPAAAGPDPRLRGRAAGAGWGRRRRSWSRSPRGGCRPATPRASPGSRRGTTTSWPGREPPPSSRPAPRGRPGPWSRWAAVPAATWRSPWTRPARSWPSRCWSRSAAPRPRWSRSVLRTGTCSPRPTGRAPRGSTSRPRDSTHPARPSRSPPHSRCSAPARRRRTSCPARRPRWSTDAPSRTTTTTRPPGWAR